MSDIEVRAVGFDHLVLITADVERSLAFYLDELGMEPVRVEEWRRGEVLFPSVRLNESAILDLLQGTPEGKNVDHICLVIEAVDLDALAESGRFDVVGGPPNCSERVVKVTRSTCAIPTAT